MDELSDKAEARGLTAEKLEEMLRATKPRFVFDTSAIISAALFKPPGRIARQEKRR